MSLLLSTYTNNIDKKGRISVPVSFRTALSTEHFAGIIAYSSIKNKCIEVCSFERLEHLSKIIQSLDPYSEERDAFETIILGGAVQLPFDKEGRIIIPKGLCEYADLKDQVCFVGKGGVCELWNPTEFMKYSQEAKRIAKENKLLLKNI